MKVRFIVWCFLFASCTKEIYPSRQTEEIATAKPTTANGCYTACDITKSPDIHIVTNAQELRPLLPDGQIDSFSFFFLKYKVRTHPIKLKQNFLVTPFYADEYGWLVGDTVNFVGLQCLAENIAKFGCNQDWVFTDLQLLNLTAGGLFTFDTYEKGNGNNWKPLFTDYKKKFQPELIPVVGYQDSTFCVYERAVPAQSGDFYYNAFRFPNHDGTYRLVIKFNPQLKGCHAILETDYSNNNVTIDLQIINGTVVILNTF